MKSILTASILFVSCALPAKAADWTQPDIDQARNVVAVREKSFLDECVASSGTKINYEVEQRDVNADGIKELIINSSPAEIKDGVTGCYGMVGKNIYLMAKTSGLWEALVIGDDTNNLVFHARQPGEWPDVELTGVGFCFPFQRHDKGEYKLWKVCDGNRQIFADTAPWIEDKSTVVPSGYSATALSVAMTSTISTEEARAMVENRAISDHNGSGMLVNPGGGTITYHQPKASIAGTVKIGTLLFKADAAWDPYDDAALINGTAYVFKKGCEPAPYKVSGRHAGWHTIVLKGAAPVREKKGCKVIGYKMNGNSLLKFESWGD